MGSQPQDDGVILSFPDKNIIVRKYRMSDAASLAKNGDNYKIWSNLRNGIPLPYTLEASEWWCNHVASDEMLATTGPIAEGTHETRTAGFEGRTAGTGPKVPTSYAIVINGQPAGSIGVMFKTDVSFRTAEIGYWLGEEHWGKGVMSSVVPAFVKWVFATFGVILRLMTEVYDWNGASTRVLEKAGFKHEGVQIDAVVKDGRIGNIIMLGCLRRYLEDDKN